MCDLAPERCWLSDVTLPGQLNPAAVQKLPDADMLRPRWKGFVKKDMLVKLFVITTDRTQLPKAKGTPNDPAGLDFIKPHVATHGMRIPSTLLRPLFPCMMSPVAAVCALLPRCCQHPHVAALFLPHVQCTRCLIQLSQRLESCLQ